MADEINTVPATSPATAAMEAMLVLSTGHLGYVDESRGGGGERCAGYMIAVLAITDTPPSTGAIAMADRVPATITIGGRIAAALIPTLVETIQFEDLSAEWDGELFDGRELPVGEPLQLYAQEVANGEFDELEAFCRANSLLFRRWSGGSPGSFLPEIIVWTGQGECRRYSANDDEQAVITAEDVKELGSYDAVVGYLAEAAFAVPALQIER